MKNTANAIVREVTKQTITLSVNGEIQKILKKLEAFQALLEGQQATTIQTADKIYNISNINEGNFNFVLEQSNVNKKLPSDLAENLIDSDNRWALSLKQALVKQSVPVGSRPRRIFQHYGWLVEIFLQKMETPIGKKQSLLRLSFMAEAFQSSLRYLCYIQIAQILHFNKDMPPNDIINEFLQLQVEEFNTFDFLNFLVLVTEILEKEAAFMPEINDFVKKLMDTTSSLYATARFLENQRTELIKNNIPEDENLQTLLDEYLTGLVFWLRKIAFLAQYRLVSIKDIQLKYRLGTKKNFVHLFGELHGVYQGADADDYDFMSRSVEGLYTYNQSVLLFKGYDIGTSFNNIQQSSTYLSLSPLIIDQSVFANQKKETPEIYYYHGQTRQAYHYAKYENELSFDGHDVTFSNKEIKVREQNNQIPKLDELFTQLTEVFDPFKNNEK